MSKTLINVVTAGSGSGTEVKLDTANSLAKIRITLEKDQIMAKSDGFISNGSVVLRSNEATITLDEYLVDASTENQLTIGQPSLSSAKGASSWTSMTPAQHLELVDKLSVRSGLILSSAGVTHSFSGSTPMVWKVEDLEYASPQYLTVVATKYSYDSVTNSIQQSSNEETSFKISFFYGSAHAAFEHSKEHSSRSNQAEIFFVGSYSVNLIDLTIPLVKMTVNSDMLQAIQKLKNKGKTITEYAELISLLNKWGYYVAHKFTFGGKLLSSSSTYISDFSSTETTAKSFSGGFEAAFDGIGGGVAYKNSHSTTHSSSHSSEFSSLSIKQVGGALGMTSSYGDWAKSLESASNWGLINVQSVPIVGLVGMQNDALGNYCYNLISKYATYKTVMNLQSYLNMSDYADQSNAMFAGGGI